MLLPDISSYIDGPALLQAAVGGFTACYSHSVKRSCITIALLNACLDGEPIGSAIATIEIPGGEAKAMVKAREILHLISVGLHVEPKPEWAYRGDLEYVIPLALCSVAETQAL